LTAKAAASIKSTVPRMSLALLFRLLPLIIVLLLSGWDGSPLSLVSDRLARPSIDTRFL
jgi:hypothetical protein